VGEDRTETGRQRVTVAEAAELLGVSVEAVRGRIKRRTLEAEREGDHVFVLLEADQSRPDTDQPTDQAQPDVLIEALDEMREQVRYLREQVQAEREAHAEARRLLLLALERIPPALEPPSQEEPRESPSEATEQPGRVEPQPAVESTQAQESPEMAMPSAGGGPQPRDQQEATERPWWRRVFGG
jgi:hypothetical protein